MAYFQARCNYLLEAVIKAQISPQHFHLILFVALLWLKFGWLLTMLYKGFNHGVLFMAVNIARGTEFKTSSLQWLLSNNNGCQGNIQKCVQLLH